MHWAPLGLYADVCATERNLYGFFCRLSLLRALVHAVTLHTAVG